MLKSILAVVGLGAVLAMGAGIARASTDDYRFEAVQKQVLASPSATVAVRLVRISTGKTVGDAVLFQPRMEMPMEGMPAMESEISAARPNGKGDYLFTADLSMPGAWVMKVSAKVQGETGTISGQIPFVAKPDHGHMDGMNHP